MLRFVPVIVAVIPLLAACGGISYDEKNAYETSRPVGECVDTSRGIRGPCKGVGELPPDVVIVTGGTRYLRDLSGATTDPHDAACRYAPQLCANRRVQ